MTIEVLVARRRTMSRKSIEGLVAMLDKLGDLDDEDAIFGDEQPGPFVEFRMVERDMLSALEALDALGFALLKLEPVAACDAGGVD